MPIPLSFKPVPRGGLKNPTDFLDEENGEMLKKDSEIQEVPSFPMNLENFCGKVGLEPYFYYREGGPGDHSPRKRSTAFFGFYRNKLPRLDGYYDTLSK